MQPSMARFYHANQWAAAATLPYGRPLSFKGAPAPGVCVAGIAVARAHAVLCARLISLPSAGCVHATHGRADDQIVARAVGDVVV